MWQRVHGRSASATSGRHHLMHCPGHESNPYCLSLWKYWLCQTSPAGIPLWEILQYLSIIFFANCLMEIKKKMLLFFSHLKTSYFHMFICFGKVFKSDSYQSGYVIFHWEQNWFLLIFSCIVHVLLHCSFTYLWKNHF